MKIQIQNKGGNGPYCIRIRRTTEHDRTENVFGRLKKRSIKALTQVGIILTLAFILFLLLSFLIKPASADLQTNYRYGKYNQAVTVFDTRVETMKKRGYSDTKILDLSAILTMECNRYSGKCFNGNDIGPFQVNKIHKEHYNKSWELYDNPGTLFLYQLDFISDRWDRFNNGNCSWENARIYKKPNESVNERRAKCQLIHHNGHPTKKYVYAELGWGKRKIISDYLF